MQIFELHFNPKLREEQIFDSFIFEPENAYERKLGSLYMIGELQNALPQKQPSGESLTSFGPARFLDGLAKVIKKNYYTLSPKSSEKALSQTLKKANEFLAEEVKKENVSWLGNLNFAVLSLKDFNLIFTKTGDLKILLIRAGQITDIGKNLDLREIEPYPLKIFLNVVSGKLSQDDIILVLTKEIFEFFQAQNLLTKLAQTENLNSKKIKEILPSSLFVKGEGSKVSGICFLSLLKTEPKPAKRPREIYSQKEKKFSFSQIFSPLLRPFQKIAKSFKLVKTGRDRVSTGFKLPKLPNPCTIFKKTALLKGIIPKTVRGKISFPIISIKKKLKSLPRIKSLPSNVSAIKKKLILVLVLIIILFFGFLIFKKVEDRKENEIRTPLNEIQGKVNQAENFLIFGDEEKANSLFKEAWREILPLTEVEIPFLDSDLEYEIFSLKQSIEENLTNLNKSEKIESPEEASELEYKKALSLLALPENLTPPPGFNLDLFASYLLNIYSLDKKTCKIIKYPYLGASNWGPPQIWKEEDSYCSNPKSMAIDGSVWILNEDNSIVRYHLGSYQETLTLDIFPPIENISKIETKPEAPYLYFLEPAKKRIVITDKAGKIVKQFQSEKFNNLKDFSISDDGKIIYLLNDSKIYKIEI